MTTTEKRYQPQGAISLNEAKRRLGLPHTTTLNRLINAGEVQAFRLGNRRWVVESSVQTYLEKRGQGHGTENSQIC